MLPGNKISVAVRSTALALEVPLTDERGALLVGAPYLAYLARTANRRFEQNARHTERLHRALQLAFAPPPSSPGPGARWQLARSRPTALRRWGHSAVAVPEGVLVFGGYGHKLELEGAVEGSEGRARRQDELCVVHARRGVRHA